MYLIRTIGLLIFLVARPSFADVTEQIAGSIEAHIDGKPVLLATLRSDYQIQISGDIVNVKLRQTFQNPYDQPLNARYLFPLSKEAAVHAMTMKVGNEIISAEIQEIVKAQKTFVAAKKAGKAAALLRQHRPNMFTQSIANLMPNQPIVVEIEYTHLIGKVDGEYELVVPLIVGPRFQPAGAGVPPVEVRRLDAAEAGDSHSLEWELEALPERSPTAGVELPNTISGERVSLQLELETPVPLQDVRSDTHPLTSVARSSTQQSITFAEGRVLDNKDFVLRYRLAGAQINTGVLTHWQADGGPIDGAVNGGGGYFSLLIEPPKQVSDAQVLAREMVFLLDCSGSMSGMPMAASKLFMSKALAALRPTDTFRIIRFSDKATEMSGKPLPATPQNIAWGLDYTSKLSGHGGTHMASGIEQALGSSQRDGVVRNVIFLTDGYIGNEASILKLVHELRGDARLFAFGVGTGVNRYLLSELSRVGRGFTRYLDPTQESEEMQVIASDLANRLQSPVLTNIEIDWGELQVSEVVPHALPDLYAGDVLRVSGRYAGAQSGTIAVKGRTAKENANLRKTVQLSGDAQRASVRRIWAREAIRERMHQLVTPLGMRDRSDDQLKAEVTALGLHYDLATKWTAFVAVSRRIVNPVPQASADADVALPMVAGVNKAAYGQKGAHNSLTATTVAMPQAMTGYGAPEPGIWLSLGSVATVLGILRILRRRRERTLDRRRRSVANY